MAQPEFRGNYINLVDRWGRQLRLYRDTWNVKRGRDDRWFLTYNYEKIVETLADPDFVIESKKDVCVYQKSFGSFSLDAQNRKSLVKSFWVSVVGKPKKRMILTFYPADNIKAGKVLYDESKGINHIRQKR